MRKGFTLIELLAVIIILAIIIAIAVPTVLNIVDKSKSKSNEVSKELYLRAVEQAIATKNVKEEFNPTLCEVNEDGKLICTEGEEKKELLVEVSGTRPCKGSITIKNKEVASESLDFCDGKLPQDTPEEPIPDIPDPESFEKDSWPTIIKAVQEKNTDKYHVGDTKEIELTGEEFTGQTFTVRIANMSDGKEGCGGEDFSETACGFVIEFTGILIDVSENMYNYDGTYTGGWSTSLMRELVNSSGWYVDGGVFNSLPQELQKGIIDTKVVSGHEDGVSENYTTIDKLYLLSPTEVYGADPYFIHYDSAWDKTRQLDYYKQEGVTDGSSGAKKWFGEPYLGDERTDTQWAFRSLCLEDCVDSPSYLVSSRGRLRDLSGDGGISPAFRLG